MLKKIIHLSDLHVGYKVCGHRFDRIVDSMIYLKEHAGEYVVLITGDLVDDATDEDNYLEVKKALDRLISAGFDLLVVPGNHDYGTGTLASKKYVKKFKEWFFGNAGITYPKLDIIGEAAFIGLDSMAEELDKWDERLLAEGELGEDQIGRLAEMLSSDDVKHSKKRIVYLHHHPFDPYPAHELKDSDALRKVVEGEGIDALLYGHNHMGKKRNGKWGIPRCYDAGSATFKTEIFKGYHRVIDLERDPRWDYDGEFL